MLAQDHVEATTRVLLRQLMRRFGELPPELVHRIRIATQAELDLWNDRSQRAPSLEEVFGQTFPGVA
ncbi:MAG: DUF4351 domain-containing protein [Planctomycetes bacterium]|nr:DUF4351 domain-containing protein [Planctomycetota bacterium]